MRVHVDGTTHPIHDEVPSAAVTLTTDDGTAEVQIAQHGDRLVVIMAGQVEWDSDQRGNDRATVFPS